MPGTCDEHPDIFGNQDWLWRVKSGDSQLGAKKRHYKHAQKLT